MSGSASEKAKYEFRLAEEVTVALETQKEFSRRNSDCEPLVKSSIHPRGDLGPEAGAVRNDNKPVVDTSNSSIKKRRKVFPLKRERGGHKGMQITQISPWLPCSPRVERRNQNMFPSLGERGRKLRIDRVKDLRGKTRTILTKCGMQEKGELGKKNLPEF